MTKGPPSVARRRVFYIPGYDPHPSRRYRELYRTESRLQAKHSGYRIGFRAVENHPTAWEVAGEMEGGKTRSRVDVLEWSDIVRETMNTSLGATYLQMLRVIWVYVFSGALRRLMWLNKGPIIAGFYPVLMLLLQLVGAVLAGALVAYLVKMLLTRGLGLVLSLFGGEAFVEGAIWTSVMSVLGWAIVAVVAYPLLRYFKSLDHRLFAHYLMHDLAYTAKNRGAYPQALDLRLKQFSERVAEALASPVDEVLVVGHSSGAALAVSVIADLVRQGRVPANGATLSLLTLGEAIPMISFLPRAERLRGDLHLLAKTGNITWVDVSAPGDGCSFALCDPVAVSGVAPEYQRWPLVISAAFSESLSRETQEALKGQYLRLHFQYLCAFDRPKGYDYFLITGGPYTLRQRFADRKPSMNRIDVPASRFRSMAA